MLVFTRKRHEAIVIGDGIEVRILRVGRDGVRLGVTAPSSVSVHRREIYDQIREENRVAASSTTSVEDLAERLRRATGRAATEGQPATEPLRAARKIQG
jgi:carbon storage regulator